MSSLAMELISLAHIAWKRQVARNLVPFGTNPKQMFVLRKLQESGSLSPSEIATLIHGDRPTATSLIETLERAGRVGRRRDPHNGRRVLVEITKAGQEFYESVPQFLWRTGKTNFDPEACFTKAERAQLVSLLKELNDWLDTND